jgi:hypothetical protein
LKKKIKVLILVGFSASLIFMLLLIWSSRIPERWQELRKGMTRSDIIDFIGEQPYSTALTSNGPQKVIGEDQWRIKRLIGNWLLSVNYNENLTFRSAYLRYHSPFFGDHGRARNYNEYDEPYEIRKNK